MEEKRRKREGRKGRLRGKNTKRVKKKGLKMRDEEIRGRMKRGKRVTRGFPGVNGREEKEERWKKENNQRGKNEQKVRKKNRNKKMRK